MVQIDRVDVHAAFGQSRDRGAASGTSVSKLTVLWLDGYLDLKEKHS
jgi:hypothetical protein